MASDKGPLKPFDATKTDSHFCDLYVYNGDETDYKATRSSINKAAGYTS
jgi:hypothetical protein